MKKTNQTSFSISLPVPVAGILAALEAKRFAAHVVGGCVRDSLLGQMPHDWDIGTSATPEEVLACFSGERTIPTGLVHGTVTLVREGVPYEITTFRVDGNYSDGRHPDSVHFVRNIVDDLARRDFTVNAMAYSPSCGLIDCFGGQADLEKREIRAVGKPAARFGEDALRILRALRFASAYGFSIEEETARAASNFKNTLKNVAIERVFTEFVKLLCGCGAEKILTQFADIIAVFLPEILPCIGFQQNHPRHIYDVWRHTAVAIGAAPPDKALRLALLFHDLAKPRCIRLDERGIAHDEGHCAQGAEECKKALKRLRCDVDTTRMVELLVLHHGTRLCPVYPPEFHARFQAWLSVWRTQGAAAFGEMPMEILEPGLRQARRWLGRLGEERVRMLVEVQRADIKAQDAHFAAERLRQLENFDGFLQLAQATNQCYCLRDLQVDGKLLMQHGFIAGPELGRTLEVLLEDVVEGCLPNERRALLSRAQALLEKMSKSENE